MNLKNLKMKHYAMMLAALVAGVLLFTECASMRIPYRRLPTKAKAFIETYFPTESCVYAERVCVTDIANINKAKKAIKKAFQKQMNGEGFTFIEVLSTCPTNWGMTPLKANQWLKDNMVPYYPLGVIKETAPEGAEVK